MHLASSALVFSVITSVKAGLGGRSPSVTPEDTCGNTGLPYGSNMIRIAESDLTKYNYTITVVGSSLTEDYDIIAWNTCDKDHTVRPPIDSFPLQFTVPVGSTQYIAMDDGSEGSFIAFPSNSAIPRNALGVVLGFWGEFTFADVEGFSRFDVCAYEAIKANRVNFPELKIQGNGEISSIATNLTFQHNALMPPDFATLTSRTFPSGPLALTATIGYNG